MPFAREDLDSNWGENGGLAVVWGWVSVWGKSRRTFVSIPEEACILAEGMST